MRETRHSMSLKNRLTSLAFFVFAGLTTQAQYTETINSNRPGQSQGAFAVGNNVIQLETGAYMGNDEHSGLGYSYDIWGIDYQLRYGLLMERLEINLTGAFENQDQTYNFLGTVEERNIRNFRSNTLGLKYLVYDPNVSLPEEKPNLYSWKANQRFKWRTLIPAISVYAGANFAFGDNPYLYPGEGKYTPKAAIITQNNWGRTVLVLNLIGDRLSEEYRSLIGIATVAHAITPQFAIFGEYQGINSDVYADDILRGGAAYLFGTNFQVDVSGLINFKNTPSRWQVAAGISWRVDLHEVDEFLEDSNEGNQRKARSEKMSREREDDGDGENDGGI